MPELDPEKFLEQHVESDDDSDAPLVCKKLPKLNSAASDHYNSSSDSDDSNKKRMKKKKKKKKTKKSAKSSKDSNDGGLSDSQLTDDEEDDLLKDLSTLLNEPSVGADVNGNDVDMKVLVIEFKTILINVTF